MRAHGKASPSSCMRRNGLVHALPLAGAPAAVHIGCVITTTNQVFCAGDEDAVGNALLTSNQPDLTAVAGLAVSSDHHVDGGHCVTCVGTTTAVGTTFCFGQGSNWQENGTTYGTANMTQVAVGYDHFCALDSGQVVCRGACVWGQCGTSEPVFLTAVTPVLAGVTAVWAGEFSTCARRTDNSIVCWGKVMQGAPPDEAPIAISWVE